MACIELIGCTSSGKSTLINAILRFCQEEGIAAWVGDDFILKQVRLDKIKSVMTRAILVNLISLLVALATWQKNSKFYQFAFRFIAKLPVSVTRSEKLYIAKNILKNIGIFEFVRWHISANQIVLLDEGSLHIAQVLFVRSVEELSFTDMSNFVNLVPLPDLAIYLQRNEDILIERTLARKHKRIPGGSRILAKSFIKDSLAIFDQLIQFPLVEKRLLIVDNNQNIKVLQPDKDSPSQALSLKILRAGLDIVNKEHLNNATI